MSHVTAPNYTLAATNDTRSAIWRLSRAMKAAGWITKASSDGTNKDTTGTYSNDKWNGTIGTGGSGAGASVNSVTNGVATLTGLSGFASGTAGQRWIELSGGTSPGNNGTFKILSYISATSVTIRNSNAVAGDTVSWTERIPLSDTYTIAASSWICMQGPSTIKMPIVTLPNGDTVINRLGNNQTGAAASINEVKKGIVTITGLTGMVRGSVGRLLTISGASSTANNGTWVISAYIDSTSVQICNINAVEYDANNGSISWTEKYLKPYIRGENITQSTTGAQGELIGMHFDLYDTTAYLVIMPRVIGSGSEVFGWGSTQDITGAVSGAVLAAAGTPIEFVREIVLWSGSANTQTMTGYMQTVDGYSESAYRFSSLASSSGCTATIAPGGGGTNNSFPAPGSYVFVGTGGTKTDARFALTTWTGNLTNAQIMCADATYDTNRSADGSFICAIGVPTNAGSYLGFAFQRLDDHEDGDVDPYIVYAPSNDLAYAPSRTTYTTTYTAAGDSFNAAYGTGLTSSPGNNAFRGWKRRGFSSGDSFLNFQVGLLCTGNIYNTAGTSLFLQVVADPERVATAQTNTFVAEPIWVVNGIMGTRYFKGTCRWLRAVSGGNTTLDTLGNLSWLQLSITNPAFIGGPWDGSTTPVK